MSSNNDHEESIMDHISRTCGNCWASTIACSTNAKDKTRIKQMEYNIASRKKKFGLDYIDLVEKGATEAELKTCVDGALADINEIKEDISERRKKIEKTNEHLHSKMGAPTATPTAATASTAAASTAPAGAKTETPAAAPAPAPAKAEVPDPAPAAPPAPAVSAPTEGVEAQ